MQLTPEQRQSVVSSIFEAFNCYDTVRDPDGEHITVDEIADAAINAILSISSPPCAEVVPGASDGVPSQIKNDPVNYQTRATNRENFAEDGTGYFVWDKSSQSCKWSVEPMHGTYATSCCHMFEFNEGGPKENDFGFCPWCGKRLEVVE